MIELANDKRYVIYSPKNFKFNKDCIVTNLRNPNSINKPEEAVWASPIDAFYGWKEFCTDCEFKDPEYDFDKPVYFRLQPDTKIYRVYYEDVTDIESSNLMKYIDINKGFIDTYKINFNKMLEDGIGAVELMDSCIGHTFINKLEQCFNSWDCESIVVLDDSKIIFE